MKGGKNVEERGVKWEEIETKISWPTLHEEIPFEDCLAWRGNQERRYDLTASHSTALWPHLKCPSSSSSSPHLSLSSIAHSLSHLCLIKYCLPYTRIFATRQEIWEDWFLFLCISKQNQFREDTGQPEVILMLGSTRERGVKPGYAYIVTHSVPATAYMTMVRCVWQQDWSPWAGQQRDHTLFTWESINHNLA